MSTIYLCGKFIPLEIIHQIIEETKIRNSAKENRRKLNGLRSLQTVSKSFYKFVTPILYERISSDDFEELFYPFNLVPREDGYMRVQYIHWIPKEHSINVHTDLETRPIQIEAEPNPELPRPLRIRQNLTFVRMLTLNLLNPDLFYGLSTYPTKETTKSISILLSHYGQLLLPNVHSICYILDYNHNPPSKILNFMKVLCSEPKNICMKWNQYDEYEDDAWSDEEDIQEMRDSKERIPRSFIPMIFPKSIPINITYHDIDLNLIEYITLDETTKISLGKIIHCDDDHCRSIGNSKMYYQHDRGHQGCKEYYETEPQEELISKCAKASRVSIMQGSTEFSMSKEGLMSFKAECDRQLKEIDDNTLRSGRPDEQFFEGAKQMKWYIGEDAIRQHICEVCRGE
ncbi:uncharacterized protein L201_002527 [Kwoniella dendrophila CBS 6074]|uniref:F-box domain-containing protein n=1 Tax=Kwoniella dendrophila CBS 6074 TaxID=1295534 RepID=A0AAX4JQD9_9TREE